MLARDAHQENESILQEKYQLRPNNYQAVFAEYGKRHGYDELHRLSKIVYKPSTAENSYPLEDHASIIRTHLPQNYIQQYAEYFKSTDENARCFEDVLPLLEKILSPEVDAAIKDYYQSNYAVLWCNWYVAKHPDHDAAYLNKWHCDAGPVAHLKTITYFDDSVDHGSGTAMASLSATEALKSVGYVMNDIRTRQVHIDDLTEHNNINLDHEILRFQAGDTLIFNPTMRMHRVELPKEEEKRHAFSIGFVPSPIPWRELIKLGLEPESKSVPFETFAKRVMDIVYPSERADNTSNMAPDRQLEPTETIVLNEHATITSVYSLKTHLTDIFKDEMFAEKIKNVVLSGTGPNFSFTIKELILKLKESFHRELAWNGFFSRNDLDHMKSLLDYESRLLDTENIYNPNLKPNPEAVMWPMPNHPKYPKNKYEMRPFVQRHKILDKETPIASAGSCFAYEIAKRFQTEAFNYLVEEPVDEVTNGVFIDQYQKGDVLAPASANYGILFNTPSLRQLAERAFGLRPFQKFFTELNKGIFCDPYRENVYFNSVEAYEKDYPKHLAAVRRVLTKSEVFIFTAGLNECWELFDGTVISRNPKPSIQHLLKHRVLTVQENINNFKGFVDIVRQYNPKMKFVISLSPVPLMATGRADTHHILEANTHSKAVLRVAIDEFIRSTPNTYYLPSYELVTECSENAWLPDHRHVTPDTVNRVIDMFKDMFYEETSEKSGA